MGEVSHRTDTLSLSAPHLTHSRSSHHLSIGVVGDAVPEERFKVDHLPVGIYVDVDGVEEILIIGHRCLWHV